MARIRSVHPALCTSETMARVSAAAERTFVRFWTHCDDEGRAEDHPRLLKAALFPLHDDVTADDVEAHLEELCSAGQIVRYDVGGKRFIEVTGWAKWQKPQRPTRSKLPAPSASDRGEVDEPALSRPRGLHAGVGDRSSEKEFGGGAERPVCDRIREYYATRHGCDPHEVDEAIDRVNGISADLIDQALDDARRKSLWPRQLADIAQELERMQAPGRGPCPRCDGAAMIEGDGGVRPCPECNASAARHLERERADRPIEVTA